MEIFEYLKQGWIGLRRKLIAIKSSWNNFPEQVKRLTVIVVLLLTLFFVARSFLIPTDFGEYGHYRSSAVTEIITQDIKYAGRQICYDCHDDIVDIKQASYHKNVSCEVCHGPAAMHTEDEEVKLRIPRERGYCPLCHEYLPSRPTGFPQIISASHNPMKPCIECHNPHDPKPSETPKNCEACHAEIANSKSLSKHVYIPCIRCHETPEQHKLQPRRIFAGKPENREFCGGCHGQEATSNEEIPRIDLQTHEESYVCWQCHYPHQPEAQ